MSQIRKTRENLTPKGSFCLILHVMMRLYVWPLRVLSCVPQRGARRYHVGDRECLARSDDFYEEHNKKRQYFYVMDLRGQLFVENVVRNIATSMKDIKFLDFMYKNLQWNETGFNTEIPLVTYCGKEMNFVTPIDRNSVLVYKDLLPPSNQGDGYKLLYGGTVRQDFDPARLAFSTATGRMYHELSGHKNISGKKQPVYGLLNVNITSHFFSDSLVFSTETTPSGDSEDTLHLEWRPSPQASPEHYKIRML